MDLFIGLLVLFCCVPKTMSPATDRVRFLQRCRQEFNDCIFLLTVHEDIPAATILEANRRLRRLRLQLQLVEGTFLNINQIAELTGIVDSTLNTLAGLQAGLGVPYEAPLEHRNGIGRPRFDITREQLNLFLSCRFSVTMMANMMHVSTRTVARRLRSFGMEIPRFSAVNDGALDEQVHSIVSLNRMIGPNTVRAYLRNSGTNVQRHRVRDSMRRTDTAGFAFRSIRRIQRRTYRVAGPNSLWHLDGYHKLITWRLVIHVGIDENTRVLTFIDVSNNNRATTVLSGFMQGVATYGIPSRIRCNYGGENNLVARFMEVQEVQRGIGRRSVIRVSRVRNQRIQRLWCDVWRVTVNVFYDLFTFMERQHILDANNELHLYALHYVFIPRIRQSTINFRDYWNNHGLRTEHNFTPHQLFVSRSLELVHSHHTAMQEMFSPAGANNLDPHLTIPRADMDHAEEPGFENNVTVVPHVPEILSEIQLGLLMQEVNPLNETADNNLGIELYLRTLVVIRRLLRNN